MTLPTPSQRLAGTLTLIAIALALFALGSWAAGSWEMAAFGRSYVPMKPVTALLFLLLGFAHLAWLRGAKGRNSRLAMLAAMFVVAGAGLLVVLASWLDLELPWDAWPEVAADQRALVQDGRVSPLTGAGFLLSAAGFFGVWRRAAGPLTVRLATLAAIAGLSIGFVAAVSYAAGVPLLYTGPSVPMAVPTAFAFVALNLGVLLGGPIGPKLGGALDFEPGLELSREAEIFRRRILLVGLAGAAAVVTLGFVYFRSEQAIARDAIEENLNAIADLKAGEISGWRSERHAEGRFLMQAPFVAADLAALAARPDDPSNQARVRGWLEPIKGGERYSSAIVVDAAGTVLLAIPESAQPRPGVAAHLATAVAAGESILTDLHREDGQGGIRLELVVPIFPSRPPDRADQPRPAPTAIILLQLDPEKFLFPLLQRWPGRSETAETLLVRREGDTALYLNELRHQRGTALTLRRPIDQSTFSGLMTAPGVYAVQETRDYRGVAVLSTARPIPASPWLFVAKVDQAEVYKPIRQGVWRNVAVLVLLLGSVWAGVTAVWRRGQADLLNRYLAEQKQHEQQISRLSRLYAALSHVNQAIVRTTAREEIFPAVCHALVEFGHFKMVWVGWRDPATEEIRLVAASGDETGYLKGIRVYADDRPEGRGPTGTAIRENRTDVCNDFVAEPRTLPWRALAKQAGIGSSISLPIRVEGRAEGALTAYAAEPGFFGSEEVALLEEAASDVSFALENLAKEARRQETETALIASEARFRALYENSLDGFLITTTDGRVLSANPAACRMLGRPEEEICRLGRGGLVDQSDPRLLPLVELRARTGRAVGELRFVRGDGAIFEAEVSASVFDTPEGNRSSLAIRDITLRKKAETQLNSQLEELRRWHAITVGREARVLALKREVNELLAAAGQPPRYASAGEPTAREASDAAPAAEDGNG